MLQIEIQIQLKKFLKEFYPVWLNLPPLDHRRVLTPERVGAFKISIELYHGLQSNLRTMVEINANSSVVELRDAIEKLQPELIGFLAVPGHSLSLGDISRHITQWCQYISKKIPYSGSVEKSIENLIAELNDLISQQQVIREIFTPIDGLVLAEDCDEIQLDQNLILRKLSMDELKELVSEDALFSTGRAELFRSVSTVMISKHQINFTIGPSGSQIDAPQFDSSVYDPIECLSACLHILKPGKFLPLEYQHRFVPDILPFPKYAVGSFRERVIGLNVEINRGDESMIKQLYAAYKANENGALKIAIGRLTDAENRMSLTDSLLDSVIGLEVLLNPVDRAELSFRVALHYAVLGNKSMRKNRYEDMRKIQEMRNYIVHGGANLNSTRANEIATNAVLARNCLREVITKFLTQDLFERKKLDANFWVDLVLGAT